MEGVVTGGWLAACGEQAASVSATSVERADREDNIEAD